MDDVGGGDEAESKEEDAAEADGDEGEEAAEDEDAMPRRATKVRIMFASGATGAAGQLTISSRGRTDAASR